MRDWRIRQRYGFGAARVPVPGLPYRAGAPPLPLRQALARARAERRAEGARGPAAGLLRMLPLVLAAWVGLLAGGEILFAPGPEQSEIALVPLALEEELAELAEAEPEPEVELAEQAPPPELEPVPEVEAPSEAEPVVVAEAKPPAPEPEPEPEAAPVRPRVQIDALAQRPTPIPEAQRRAPREAPPERAPAPAPDLALAALAAPEDLAPRESRSARLRPTAPQRSPVPLAAPPLPSLDVPASEGGQAPIRIAHSAPRAAPAPLPLRPELAPVADLASVGELPRENLPRAPRPAARESASPGPPRPQLAFGGSPAPPRDPALPAPSGATRASRSPAPRSRRTPTGPRPELLPAKLELGGSGPESATAAAPTRSARAGAAALEPARSAPAARGAGLQGVPLGSLRACISDAREDALKQQLMAAVTTQQECASNAGRYRFVETRNLNAFLMWIERAPGRREADRCGELTLALECLAVQKRKESRSR